MSNGVLVVCWIFCQECYRKVIILLAQMEEALGMAAKVNFFFSSQICVCSTRYNVFAFISHQPIKY